MTKNEWKMLHEGKLEAVDQEVVDLLACYEYACEQFDVTICTGVPIRGISQPGNAREFGLVSQHGRQMWAVVARLMRQKNLPISEAKTVLDYVQRWPLSEIEKRVNSSSLLSMFYL